MSEKLVERAREAKAVSEYITACHESWRVYYESKAAGGEVDETTLEYYRTAVDQLEDHGYAVEENGATLDIFLVDPELTAYDPTLMVEPSAFLKLAAVTLSSLTEILDVQEVRRMKVCCVLVLHAPKEGGQWYKICGSTGSHNHHDLWFCGRHSEYPRTQPDSGKIITFSSDDVACSSQYGLGCYHCLSDAHLVEHSKRVGKEEGDPMGRPFILAKNTRSPLKKVKGRRIPAIDEGGSLSDDSRTPSPSADKEGGVFGADESGQDERRRHVLPD